MRSEFSTADLSDASSNRFTVTVATRLPKTERMEMALL
jgi:hypothetical protein